MNQTLPCFGFNFGEFFGPTNYGSLWLFNPKGSILDDWYIGISFNRSMSLTLIFDRIKLVGQYTNEPWNPLKFVSKFDIHPPKCLDFEGFFGGDAAVFKKQINLSLF